MVLRELYHAMFGMGLRYARQIALSEIGQDGFNRIRESSVLVVGVGGTGSPVADLFARSGIGRLGLVDGDKVDVTNLHRQILFGMDDIGKNKAEAAARALGNANPEVKLQTWPLNISRENASGILSGWDIVIDGTDNFAARRIINSFCVRNRIPWIFSSSVGTVAQVKAIIPGKTSCLSCFLPGDQQDGLSCQEFGVLASSPLMAGSLAWSIALKILLGREVKGDLFVIDPWNQDFTSIRIERNASCPECSSI